MNACASLTEMNREVICVYALHHRLHNAGYTQSSIAIRVNGQNSPVVAAAIQDCAKYFMRLFFLPPWRVLHTTIYVPYVRDSGDRYSNGGGEREGRVDMDTCTVDRVCMYT